ncbi:porin [Salipiger abyssi]|uniref:porin n=1 Tax=Salipiger abyssi TaxID=1250539 RepID=UPI001A90C79B|nr:porin [Salipiger abyssi]MBN9886851.1 porin [Salipiger abyssi]
MKKILFATTALVATAGVASAEVALTGTAEMGIYSPSTEDADTQFFTDFDIRFTLSGEADNGLTFGATIDLDEAADNKNPGRFELPGKQGGEAVFISYGGATLTMGDTDGAYDARIPEMALAAASLSDDETVHAGFNHGDGDSLGMTGLDGAGSDGQIARFDYAYNGFTFSLSAEQTADGSDAVITADGVMSKSAAQDEGLAYDSIGDTIWGVGVSWSGQVSMVDLTVGLGYQTLEDVADVTGIAVTGGFANGISAGLTYSVSDIDGSSDDITHVGVGFGYEMNAIAVGLNWGQFEYDGDNQSGWGLAASYDLGGGLEARLGYGYSDMEGVWGSGDDSTWSLGLNMSF